MSIHLLHKNTFRQGYIPQPKDLVIGQLGLTIHTGEVALWTKDSAGNIVQIGGGGGGDGGPSMPVYNGMLTLQKADGSLAGTFTANQPDNVTIRLPEGFSGDYEDLTNKPDIPEIPEMPEIPDVGDGVLTIKDAEGNEIGTFTANQTASTTITLPAFPEAPEIPEIPEIPEVPEVFDGTLTIKDALGQVLGTFSANQEEAAEIIIPASESGESPVMVTFGATFPDGPLVGHQHVMADTFYEYVWDSQYWVQVDVPSRGGGEAGGATVLNDLVDVTLSNAKLGDVLQHNDDRWTNVDTLDGGDY